MPSNGPYVLGGMANHGGSAGDLIRELGVTKQAASQLIDTLVIRGYLERQVSTDDRRRMTISLTDRGRAAAKAVRAGIAAVGAELSELLSPAGIGRPAGRPGGALRDQREDGGKSVNPRSHLTWPARSLSAGIFAGIFVSQAPFLRARRTCTTTQVGKH